MDAYGFSYLLKDYGIMYFGGNPLQNQTLQNVKGPRTSTNNLESQGEAILMKTSLLQPSTTWRYKGLGTGKHHEHGLCDQRPFCHRQRVGKPTSETSIAWVDYQKRCHAICPKMVWQQIYSCLQADRRWLYHSKSRKPTITPVEVNREAQSLSSKNCRNLQSTFEARISRLSKILISVLYTKTFLCRRVPTKPMASSRTYYVLDMGSLNDKNYPWLLTTLTTWALLPKPMKRSTRCINSLSTSMSLQVKTSVHQLQWFGWKFWCRGWHHRIADQRCQTGSKGIRQSGKKYHQNKRNDATINKGKIFNEALDYYATYGAKILSTMYSATMIWGRSKAEELIALIKGLPTSQTQGVLLWSPNRRCSQPV